MKYRLNTTIFRMLTNQFKEFWYFYIGAFVCLYGTHYIQSTLPFLAKDLAEMAEKGSESIPLGQFGLLAIGIIFFRTSSRLLFFAPARVQQKYLRVEMLHRLERANPFRYRDVSAGQLFQTLSGDIEQIRALVGFALLQVGNIVIALCVLLPRLSKFNSSLLIALSPLVLAFAIFTIVVGRNKKYFKLGQEKAGELNNFLIESYNGKKTIKNYHAEKPFSELFRDSSLKELWYFYKSGVSISISMPLIPLGVGMSLIWGAGIIREADLGASSLILFSGFVFLFLEPLMFVSWIGVVFARSSASWERVKALIKSFETKSSQEEFLSTKNVDRDKAVVEYWGDETSLGIKEKGWNIFIGKTGCGKSYLLAQLAELYRQKNQQISYVGQEPYIYNDSLLANLFLGREISEDNKAQAFDLLKIFDLDFLSGGREELFAMELGENGKRLSGGQAKRVCLIRSILSNASIYIWDDPFSSVDLILEKKILEKIKKHPFVVNKTVILSGHRLSTAKESDHLFLVDKELKNVSEYQNTDLAIRDSEVYGFFEKQLV